MFDLYCIQVMKTRTYIALNHLIKSFESFESFDNTCNTMLLTSVKLKLQEQKCVKDNILEGLGFSGCS